MDMKKLIEAMDCRERSELRYALDNFNAPTEMERALSKSDKIAAIKAYRERTGASFLDARATLNI